MLPQVQISVTGVPANPNAPQSRDVKSKRDMLLTDTSVEAS